MEYSDVFGPAALVKNADGEYVSSQRHGDQPGRTGARIDSSIESGLPDWMQDSPVEDLRGRFHDSRSYIETGIVNEPIPLWGFREPPPLVWLVEGFIPEGFVTILAGDGGNGKSYLAIYLALCAIFGSDFLGLGTSRANVLFVDYELNADEQKRRVLRVLKGMGRSVDDKELENRFYYHRPSHPLGTDGAHEEVCRIIEDKDMDLVILDSLTVATAGMDHTSSRDMTQALLRLAEWGTVLALDHISASAAKGNQSQARPYGSVFKRNIARSTATVTKDESGYYLLNFNKANFGPEGGQIVYDLQFRQGEVKFSAVDATVVSVRHLKPVDCTLKMIAELSTVLNGGGVTVEQVVEMRESNDVRLAEGTVRNHFTALRKRGDIELKDGRAFMIHRQLGAVNRESVSEGCEVVTPKGRGRVREVSGRRVAVTHPALDGDTIWFEREAVQLVTNGTDEGTHPHISDGPKD